MESGKDCRKRLDELLKQGRKSVQGPVGIDGAFGPNDSNCVCKFSKLGRDEMSMLRIEGGDKVVDERRNDDGCVKV